MRSLTRIMEMLAKEPKNALIDEWFQRALKQYDDLHAGRYLHRSRRDYVDSAIPSEHTPNHATSSKMTQSSASSSRPALATLRTKLTQTDIDDLNTVFAFLSSPCSPPPVEGDEEGTVFVLAGNAIIPLSWELFDHIDYVQMEQPVTLIIAGGIGHSTQYLYDAVARDRELGISISQGMAEADLLVEIARKAFDVDGAVGSGKLRLIVDDESTNCGSNAIETKRILDENGIWPRRLVVVQDPTMHRRTLAGFERIYAEDERARTDGMPELLGWTLQPKVALGSEGELIWSMEEGSTDELWDPARFISLVLGEIPRLRDDNEGYGPNGAGFIAHVDIPAAVEEAWWRLSQRLGS